MKKEKVEGEKRTREVKPIVAFDIAGERIGAFPTDITDMKVADAWAVEQAQKEDGINYVCFMRPLGIFKATAQTVLKFERE